MSHATSNWIIIVGVVIFTVVGIFGSYAGYTTHGASLSTDADNSYLTTTQASDPWYAWLIPGVFVLKHDADALLKVPVLGFLIAMATFSIDDMPYAIVVFFDVLLFIVSLAVARVILAALSGGG